LARGLAGHIALLAHHGIPATQRQEIAATIGQVQENRQLQRMLERVQRAGQVIQREALQSPRFASNPTLAAIANGTGTLKNGDRGDAVRKVQHAIADAGVLYRIYGVDGIFGTETERKVRRFQAQQGVHGDPPGEVGANTLIKLDQMFPAMTLPATAGDAYTGVAGILPILSQWNAAMIRDLRNLDVYMVGKLYWADEAWDGSGWTPAPMEGNGETSGTTLHIATNATNEKVASSLYHEYQHARAPYSYRNASWAAEEDRVYTLATQWEIDRGMSADPALTQTNPTTGETEVNPGGIDAHVGTYPGLGATQPGEVISKVGANRVRVQLPNGSRIVRPAMAGDSVPGPRRIEPPIYHVSAAEWQVVTP
jgi:peptidoglycan hydrolase-like protein with peptidoglycan-binding domain